jgi:hypothetical protein
MPPFNPNVSAGRSNSTGNRTTPISISQAVLSGQMTQPENNINFSKQDGLQFPQDLPKEYIKLRLQDFTFGLGFGGLTTGATGAGTTIFLPMPKQLVDTHSVGYKQEAIGSVTGELANAIAGGGQDTRGGSIVNALVSGAAQAVGNIVKEGIGLDPVNAGLAKAGLAPNQFLTVMLTGPQYKKHELSWTLSPRNKKESELIRKIIEKFNNAMAPTLSGPFFTHPKVVTPSFTNSNVLYRFKPCVIETMSVNYAPSGAPSFYAKTAAPDSVEIRLSLLEIEFWLSGQFTGSPIGGGR